MHWIQPPHWKKDSSTRKAMARLARRIKKISLWHLSSLRPQKTRTVTTGQMREEDELAEAGREVNETSITARNQQADMHLHPVGDIEADFEVDAVMLMDTDGAQPGLMAEDEIDELAKEFVQFVSCVGEIAGWHVTWCGSWAACFVVV